MMISMRDDTSQEPQKIHGNRGEAQVDRRVWGAESIGAGSVDLKDHSRDFS